MIGGQPLTEAVRSGPPIRHVIEALESAAAFLAQGLPVSAEAMRLVAKKPILQPVWNRFYVWMGSRGMKRLAAKNGVSQDQLLAQPYAA